MGVIERVLAQIKKEARVKKPAMLLSKRAAAIVLGVGRAGTLDEMIKDGSLATVLVKGRVKITRASVEALAGSGWMPTLDAPKKASPPRVKAEVQDEVAATKAIKLVRRAS